MSAAAPRFMRFREAPKLSDIRHGLSETADLKKTTCTMGNAALRQGTVFKQPCEGKGKQEKWPLHVKDVRHLDISKLDCLPCKNARILDFWRSVRGWLDDEARYAELYRRFQAAPRRKAEDVVVTDAEFFALQKHRIDSAESLS